MLWYNLIKTEVTDIKRKYFLILFTFICAFLICGCTGTDSKTPFREDIPDENHHSNQTFSQATDAPDHTENETATEENTSDESALSLPYTMRMKGNTPVHGGPGTEYEFISTVGADGTFTIVEEATDTAGNIWGKLKSGLGWVNITLLGSYTIEKASVTACYADKELLEGENYLEYSGNLTGYVTKVAVTASKQLENVRFSSLSFSDSFSGERYTTREVLYQLERLPAGTPLVLNMTFHGDTTTYGLRFTDTDNSIRYFAISQSGKDGSLVFSEYYP